MTLPFKPHVRRRGYAVCKKPGTANRCRAPCRYADGSGNRRRSAGDYRLDSRADRSVGRADCALSRQSTVTGANGFDLSGQRRAGGAVVAGSSDDERRFGGTGGGKSALGSQRKIAGRLPRSAGVNGGKPAMGGKPGERISCPTSGRNGLGAALTRHCPANRNVKIHAAAENHYRHQLRGSVNVNVNDHRFPQ